jgi:hypothetical protein
LLLHLLRLRWWQLLGHLHRWWQLWWTALLQLGLLLLLLIRQMLCHTSARLDDWS